MQTENGSGTLAIFLKACGHNLCVSSQSYETFYFQDRSDEDVLRVTKQAEEGWGCRKSTGERDREGSG